jgi:hypothetical protein
MVADAQPSPVPLPQILFTSLGTTVLDQLSVAGEVVATDAIGGAAIFAALGARICAPLVAVHPAQIALKIQAGHDFPTEPERVLRSWSIGLDLSRLPEQVSTRADLNYHDASLESRDHKYTTPVLEMTPRDLDKHPYLQSRLFHFMNPPADLTTQVTELLSLRSTSVQRPIIIYEPRPSFCTPEHKAVMCTAAGLVDVFTPNHVEFLQIFGKPTTDPFSSSQIEELAKHLVNLGVGHDGKGVVVSCRFSLAPFSSTFTHRKPRHQPFTQELFLHDATRFPSHLAKRLWTMNHFEVCLKEPQTNTNHPKAHKLGQAHTKVIFSTGHSLRRARRPGHRPRNSPNLGACLLDTLPSFLLTLPYRRLRLEPDYHDKARSVQLSPLGSRHDRRRQLLLRRLCHWAPWDWR